MVTVGDDTPVVIEEDLLMNREVVNVLPEWSDSDSEPLISLKNSPVARRLDMTVSS